MAGVLEETDVQRGSTVTVVAHSKLQPRPTTAVGSQTSDFTPQAFSEYNTTVSVDFYNDGLKRHQKAKLTSYLKPDEACAKLVGQNMMETIDALARRKATENGIQLWKGTNTTRATLVQATAADRMKASIFTDARAISGSWQLNKYQDGTLMCLMGDEAYADLINESGSAVLSAQGYTEWGKKVLLNFEMGMLSGIRIVVSPYVKKCYGAGAAPSTSAVSTTLSSAASAGDTTIAVTANTNIAAGQWLHIGTAQTGDESDTTILTETVAVLSVSGTTITIAGAAPLGGLVYDHAALATVANNATVYINVFGGPNSLAKAFDREIGEYGQMVGPKTDGLADQWESWAWKFMGGYGNTNKAWLIRAETSASLR